MDRPFQCPKCANWYTPVPLKEGDSCVQCDQGTHAISKAGVMDCHYGQQSSTPSEARMATLLQQATRANTELPATLEVIRAATALPKVTAALTAAETTFAALERTQKDVDEILRWATVMELPGLAGEARVRRFKDLAGVEELVSESRRPPEDLAMLRRSDKVCKDIAAELPALFAQARVHIGQIRQAAQTWKAPGETRQRAAVPA